MDGDSHVVVGTTRAPLGSHHLCFATWNARALFASHHCRQGQAVRKFALFKSLCSRHQIVTCQETHGSQFDLTTLNRELPQHVHHLSTVDNRAAGGISISVNKHFLRGTFIGHNFTTIVPGRIASFKAWGPRGNLCFLAVHLVPDLPDHELQRQLGLINMHLPADAGTLTILMGDVNAHPIEEPRLVVGDPRIDLKPTRYTVALDNCLRDLIEISGDYFTYAAKGADDTYRFSKLDRFFIRGATIDILDRNPRARATNNLLDGSTPSDHSPVFVQLMPIDMSPVKSSIIPHWIARHPIYMDVVKGLMHAIAESKEKGLLPEDVLHPHGMRVEYKKLLHYARMQTMDHIRHGPH